MEKETRKIAVDVFLKKNGYKIETTNEDGERLTLGVATGDIDIEESTKWFEMNSVPYQI